MTSENRHGSAQGRAPMRGAEPAGTMRRWWLLTPLLFSLSPLMSLFATNADELKPLDMLGPMATAAVLTALVTAAAYAVTRRVSSTVVLGSLVAGIYYNYGHFASYLEEAGFGANGSFFTADKVLYTTFAVGVLLMAVFAFRRPAAMVPAAKVLLVMGVSLAVTSTAGAVTAVVRLNDTTQTALAETEVAADDDPAWAASAAVDAAKGLPEEEPAKPRDTRPPDIYYIVLDCYASNSSMKEVLRYDNSAFTDYLTRKGFYVAADSKSNYSQTFICLASILNMDYMNDTISGMQGSDRTKLYNLIKRNKVVKTLKKRGYKYVHVTSGWGATNSAPMADVVHEVGGTELGSTIGGTTMFKALANRNDSKKKHAAVKDAFTYISKSKSGKKPKFVFAHILAPHGPYVFKANGAVSIGSHTDMTNWRPQQKNNYVAQVKAINAMTKKMVDRIIANSNRPVIIIIQGDHGTSFTPSTHSPGRYRERHGILNAMYFSEGAPSALYQGISPVNTFRVVFNDSLGKRYKLLKDRAYASRNYDNPYRVRDVTRYLRSATSSATTAPVR